MEVTTTYGKQPEPEQAQAVADWFRDDCRTCLAILTAIEEELGCDRSAAVLYLCQHRMLTAAHEMATLRVVLSQEMVWEQERMDGEAWEDRKPERFRMRRVNPDAPKDERPT